MAIVCLFHTQRGDVVGCERLSNHVVNFVTKECSATNSSVYVERISIFWSPDTSYVKETRGGSCQH
jgi:hypothetical protein